MTTTSRVRDTRKPITSRTALHQAEKARDTLQTAQAILRNSGGDFPADLITPNIADLNREIRAYYNRERAGRPDRQTRAQRELAQAKKPISSLEAWDEHERLTDIAEGRA